ncbi:MAG: hypothetical protein KAU62_17195 [Candidatus Heimdallarchaeota archaeon]|nr:hypothetical protein [Candidatus Heimdallarchaeota archaeon]
MTAHINAKNFASSFGFNYQSSLPLPIIQTDNFDIIVTHPLWDTSKPYGILKETIEKLSDKKIKFIDGFNLARRQSWCRIYLFSSS